MKTQAIRLRNFRGFRNASIELKPLTVLLGPNSAGKSTFGHALAAMSHAQWVHNGSAQATLSPGGGKTAEEWPIDLGQYKDLCSNSIDDRVYIDLMMDEGEVCFGFGNVKNLTDLRLSYISQPRAPEHSGSEGLTTPAVPQQTGFAWSGTEEVKAVSGTVGPGGIVVARRDEVTWENAEHEQVRLGLNGLILETLRPEKDVTETQLDTVIRRSLRAFLERLTYLRASRKRPSRGYEPATGGHSPIGYAGEWAASVLNSPSTDRYAFAVPLPIPNKKEEASKVIDVAWELRNATLLESLDFWMQHLGLAKGIETRKSQLYPGRIEIRVVPVSGHSVRDITEVGYGISQVLPILIAGLLQSPESIYVVDLPEAHLHPRPQADLADFFCSLAMAGRHILVETHSEMFFHRLRLRAAMNSELMNKIAVYFCKQPDADGMCIQPCKVGLQYEQELSWPAGFLHEAWEMETQIGAIREGRKLLQK